MWLKHPFHTASKCPGCLHRVVAHRAAKRSDVHLVVHPPCPASDVEQPRAEAITKTPAESGKPWKLLVHGEWNSANRPITARALRGGLEVAFHTKHHLTSLPVVAELPATEQTRQIA